MSTGVKKIEKPPNKLKKMLQKFANKLSLFNFWWFLYAKMSGKNFMIIGIMMLWFEDVNNDEEFDLLKRCFCTII